MAPLSSGLSKPTPLSKLRPQLGGMLLVLVVGLLMLVCPYLSFIWHLSWMASLLSPHINVGSIGVFMYGFFLRLSIFFFVRAPGLKVHLYGDVQEILRLEENVLYISNHQSSMDWIMACFVAMRARCLTRIRFIMKQELHWVPMVGFYLTQIGHIYVRRKGFNQDRMLQNVDHITRSRTPIWLGIFPEGTRFNPEDSKALVTSEEVARSCNLPVLKHQLTPRCKGSWLLIDRMRPHLNAVYSMTVVYEQPGLKGQRPRPPGVIDVIRGSCSDVHVHVKRIPLEEVPRDETAFTSWLHGQFVERDRLLEAYHSTHSFSSWGPKEEDPVWDAAGVLDLSMVVLMMLGLLVAPFVRKMYLMTALTTTLCGYAVLRLRPPF